MPRDRPRRLPLESRMARSPNGRLSGCQTRKEMMQAARLGKLDYGPWFRSRDLPKNRTVLRRRPMGTSKVVVVEVVCANLARFYTHRILHNTAVNGLRDVVTAHARDRNLRCSQSFQKRMRCGTASISTTPRHLLALRCRFDRNPRTATPPSWIGLPHPANQLDQFTVGRCTTGATLRFPAPEGPESGLMPMDHSLRLGDHQCLRPPGLFRAEGCPERPVGVAASRGLDGTFQHQQLVP